MLTDWDFDDFFFKHAEKGEIHPDWLYDETLLRVLILEIKREGGYVDLVKF